MCALKSWLESNPQMKCPSLSFLASVSAAGSAPWAWPVGESINQKVWRGPVCLSRSNLPPAPLAFWSWSVCDLCLLVWFWSLVCFGRWSEGGRERRSGYSSGFLSVWSPRAGPHPPRAPVRFLSLYPYLFLVLATQRPHLGSGKSFLPTPPGQGFLAKASPRMLHSFVVFPSTPSTVLWILPLLKSLSVNPFECTFFFL